MYHQIQSLRISLLRKGRMTPKIVNYIYSSETVYQLEVSMLGRSAESDNKLRRSIIIFKQRLSPKKTHNLLISLF